MVIGNSRLEWVGESFHNGKINDDSNSSVDWETRGATPEKNIVAHSGFH